MKRLMVTLLAVVITLMGVFWPLLGNGGSGAGRAGVDPVVISDYRADFDLARNGELTATEILTTEFPDGRKHGIFRFWDIADSADSGVRYQPEDIRVTMDGAPVPFTLSREQGGRFRVAKIGDPDRYVTAGTHRYEISYRVGNAIRGGDHAEFLWRVIPNGWQMQILQSTSSVRFPDAPTSFACRVSDGSPCTVAEPDPTTRVVTTGPLSPTVGVAVKADLPFPAPARSTLPWSVRMDPVLGTSTTVPLVAIIASLVTFVIGFLWMRRSREETPPFPVMYEPPVDPQNPSRFLTPAATYFVANEGMPKRALIANLFHLAEEGHIRLDRTSDNEWTVFARISPEQFQALDGASAAMLRTLGLTRPGDRFDADGSVSAGQKLKHATDALSSATRSWARATGVLKTSPSENIGRIVVVLVALLAAVLMIFKLVPTIAALPLAAFVIGGAGLFVRGVGTRRTRLGREVWSRAGGFERLLSTSSSQDRLYFSARKDLYTSYIPYALAFNCADAWAAKYRYETGEDPPDPVWLPGYYGVGAHGLMGGGGSFDSFESSLSSAMSAYSSSQSSSGGGGGFSGGGGGGGGGGSW